MYGQFLHGKTVACSVYSKNLEHFEKRLLQKILLLRSSCSQKFIKEVLFNNFVKRTGKNLYRSLYLIKLLASSLQLTWKATPSQVIPCKFYDIFKNTTVVATASESSSSMPKAGFPLVDFSCTKRLFEAKIFDNGKYKKDATNKTRSSRPEVFCQ